MLENGQNYFTLKHVLSEILGKICDLSDCQSVAIRLYNNGDYPYYVYEGFPEFFILKETSLCTRDNEGNIIHDEDNNPLLDCMCGKVLKGQVDLNIPHFTEKGSFWTNSTSRFLESISESNNLVKTRNMCNYSGYESVALIPIRSGSETLGLIQMNDPREGMFTLENIKKYEFIADRVALIVLGAFELQDKLDDIFELFKNFESI